MPIPRLLLSLAILFVIGCGGSGDGPPESVALAGSGSSVVRSEDGGFTWEISLPLRVRPFLLDRYVGWAAGDRQLFATMDGGRTWTDRSDALPGFSFGELVVATFADRQHGLLVATAAEEVGVPIVFRTEDGGASWAAATLDVHPGPLSPYSFLSRPACLTRAGVGILAWHSHPDADEQNVFVAITTDFGSQWQDVSGRNSLSSRRIVHGVACTGDSDLWVIEGDEAETGPIPREGRLLHSADAGAAFAPVSSPSVGGEEPSAAAVTFLDASVGWLASLTSSGGAMLHSEDGGQSWSHLLDPSSTAPFRVAAIEMSFGDLNRGLVSYFERSSPHPMTPSSNVLLVTDDAGRSWTRIQIPTAEAGLGPLRDVWIRTDGDAPSPTAPPLGNAS